MSESHSNAPWDEYRWERFLQEQERQAEKYVELLERYTDHPQRDEIIAREMGWQHLLGGESREWEDEVDASFQAQVLSGDSGEQDSPATRRHPLHTAAVAFTAGLDEMFEKLDPAVVEHPASVALFAHVEYALNMLGDALSEAWQMEYPGMSIAYLKRALFGLNQSLETATSIRAGGLIAEEVFAQIRDGVFEIRDGVVVAMGECRRAFRDRSK